MLLAVALPLSFSQAFAMVQMIPKALEIIRAEESIPKNYIFKNSKGTLLGKSSLNLIPDNWFNLSPADGAEGVSTEKTYVEFGNPVSEDIIVAVIDSGVDINHEDLQGKIWINSKEIPNNGIDDDKNGYIDDVVGWNFIGGPEGMAKIEVDENLKNGIRLVKGDPSAQVHADTLEVTREVVRLNTLKADLRSQGKDLSSEDEALLLETSRIVAEKYKSASNVVVNYTNRLNLYKSSEIILRAAGLKEISLDALRAFESQDQAVIKAKRDLTALISNGSTLERIQVVLDHYGTQANFQYNLNFDSRTIVKDNYQDQYETGYGNSDVIGPDSSHGTHVAGSIAAIRDNDLGIKGVATNVKIMALRAVPNGDERDKDVANAIRYAVDHGAKIINMSFGKAYSPYKKVVDAAVKYAEEKGVLLVHAAGNDGKNNDLVPSFPSKTEIETGEELSNWLEIGASSFEKGPSLPASFSNYGKKTVDFFAPGVDILSTTPNNSYDSYSGTSMATPTVSGVAALILSYDSDLDVEGLKSLIADTSRRYPRLKVNVPGNGDEVLFSSLSRVGTVVDVYEAVKARAK